MCARLQLTCTAYSCPTESIVTLSPIIEGKRGNSTGRGTMLPPRMDRIRNVADSIRPESLSKLLRASKLHPRQCPCHLRHFRLWEAGSFAQASSFCEKEPAAAKKCLVGKVLVALQLRQSVDVEACVS